MKTQYIQDGVLIRPFEVIATNFLSSRYYDGKGIVDLLETPRSARRWMDIQGADLRSPRFSFDPTAEQLDNLRELRDTVESVYCDTVVGPVGNAPIPLARVLSEVAFAPAVAMSADQMEATWTVDPNNRYGELVAEIAITALAAVTGHAASRLSKCHAPRCVLYFTRHNSRQHWCSDVCGNRARVARSTRGVRQTPSSDGP